jgi:large subunit ribosomal protein L9e
MVQKICSTQEVQVIEGCTVDVKARTVIVKGPRGTLTRDFKHLSVEITKDAKGLIKVSKWFGTKKQLAAVRSVVSHISNMMTGVTKGFDSKTKNKIEIRNYLGEKVVRTAIMAEGCEVDRTKEKDEIMVVGNSLENVGRSCSLIQQMCAAKHKDIRKYLDGIYVSSKRVIE